jgi:hypothetical protein
MKFNILSQWALFYKFLRLLELEVLLHKPRFFPGAVRVRFVADIVTKKGAFS